MISGVLWMLLFGELLRQFSLRVPSGDSDGEGHVSCFLRGSKFNRYVCPLRFFFLKALGKVWSRMGMFWFENLRSACNLQGLVNASQHTESCLKTGKDSWIINDPNLNFMMEENVVGRLKIAEEKSSKKQNPNSGHRANHRHQCSTKTRGLKPASRHHCEDQRHEG